MKAYKGFDKNLKCRGFQFEEGKTHMEKEANCAKNGFHCAENPMDCMTYYPDWDRSVYYIVEAAGDINEDGCDSKISCTELTLVKKLDKVDFIMESLQYIDRYPGRNSNSCYVKDDSGDSGKLFLVVRGKAPVASGELGSVIGFAVERQDSKEIEFLSVFIVDGNRIQPGVKYNANGIAVEKEEA